MVGAARNICQALSNAGLLPAGQRELLSAMAEGRVEDLLPAMIQAWGKVKDTSHATQAKGARQIAQRLQAWRDQGAELTLGMPGSSAEAVDRWLGARLVWWPRGVPKGRRIALVSSRLGRALDGQVTWFTVLRAACAKIDRRQDVLFFATSTTTAQYVKRAAMLFGLRMLQVDVPKDDTQPLERWLRQLPTSLDGPDDGPREAWLSPPVDADCDRIAAAVRHVPLRDRAVVAFCDRLMAFRVRRNGHIHQLIEARLSDSGWPPASVYVALGPDLVRTEMAGDLMAKGAVGWVVLGAIGDPPQAASVADPTAGERTSGKTVPLPPPDDWPYLTHCTRGREGPWPRQDADKHLDDLILARPDADHSALAALKRILGQQQLIATGAAIRGGTRVVSFTAVPLAELRRLRVFRPHRGRWDFEPYGICIRRDWLADCGARHVLYGDDQLWEELPPDDRPFFQLRTTRRPAAGGHIDWAVEDEWRVVGDVDLSKVPNDAALVFVPSRSEAEVIAQLSPWPVTVVET